MSSMSVLLTVCSCISMCSRGSWVICPSYMYDPDPLLTALMLLPCYHHHYSSRVAGPSAPRRRQWYRNRKSSCQCSAMRVWEPADVFQKAQRRKSPLPPGQQLDCGAHCINCLQEVRQEVRVQWQALLHKPSLCHFNDRQYCIWGWNKAYKPFTGYTCKIAPCLS